MKPILVFGVGQIAEIAAFYFTSQGRGVAAFTTDPDYVTSDTQFGRPHLAIDEALEQFPAGSCDAFVAIGQARMNELRREKAEMFKANGYALASYVSDKATILTDRIGEHAFILEDNTIQPFVSIGDNVVLWSGNHVGHHGRIGDNVFVTSHVVLSGSVEVGHNSFLGVNASVHDGVTLAPFTLVGAGAMIARDTAPESVHILRDTTEERRIKSTRMRKF